MKTKDCEKWYLYGWEDHQRLMKGFVKGSTTKYIERNHYTNFLKKLEGDKWKSYLQKRIIKLEIDNNGR